MHRPIVFIFDIVFDTSVLSQTVQYFRTLLSSEGLGKAKWADLALCVVGGGPRSEM